MNQCCLGANCRVLSQHTVPIANPVRYSADPVRQMADSPSIPGVSNISGDPSRQGGGRSPRRRQHDHEPEPRVEAVVPPDTPAPHVDDPTAPLIQALDRLRATQELRPVESELVRALRGVKYYQEESRHDLPVLDDPAADDHDHLPPDQVG